MNGWSIGFWLRHDKPAMGPSLARPGPLRRSDDYRPTPIPAAWRYRDYVVRSFNVDRPYDRFLTEQLAGDELDPDDPELCIATGDLRGPQRIQPVNVPGQWADILNDIADVTGEVFLGLSIGTPDATITSSTRSSRRNITASRFFTPLLPRDTRRWPGRRSGSSISCAWRRGEGRLEFCGNLMPSRVRIATEVGLGHRQVPGRDQANPREARSGTYPSGNTIAPWPIVKFATSTSKSRRWSRVRRRPDDRAKTSSIDSTR